MTSTRRSFLASSAAAAGAFAMSGCAAPGRRRPARDPALPARLMVIGVAGRGGDNLGAVADQDLRVLCDVDARHLAAAAKRFPAARLERDFRAVLTDAAACRELDGVVVSTPDHTHYPATMLALQQGLDVYCEKPLTHTVAQARRLRLAAARHGCVTQMGTQIHANANYRRVVEAVRAGAVGPVREVVVFVNGTDWSAASMPPAKAAPDFLDWELWLGPAAAMPYAEGFHPAGWRRYWAFGGGTTADMSCHFTDLAFWALDLDAPTSLLADGDEPHADCAPKGLRCEYTFAARGDRPALTLRWHAGSDRPNAALAERGLADWRNGVLFVGDDGWLIADYSRYVVGPDGRRAAFTPPPASIVASPGHHREWLDCSARGTQPSCSFAYAAPLTEHVLLANAAFRGARGRRLPWNAAAMTTGAAAVDALLDEPVRAGYPA